MIKLIIEYSVPEFVGFKFHNILFESKYTIKILEATITNEIKITTKLRLTVASGIFFLNASTECLFLITAKTAKTAIPNVVVLIPPAVEEGAAPMNIQIDSIN